MKKYILICVLISLVFCSCSKNQTNIKEANAKKVNNTETNKSDTNKTEDTNKATNNADKNNKNNSGPNKIEDNKPVTQKPEQTIPFKKTKRPSLSEKVYNFKMIDSITTDDKHKISLIGFDSEYYYFQGSDSKNYNFYISSIKDRSLNSLYNISSKNDIFFNEIYDGKLFICFGYWENRICHFQIISVNNNGANHLIYKGDSEGYPIISMTHNYIILNNIIHNKTTQYYSIIATVNMDNSSYKEIVSTQFSRKLPVYNGIVNMYDGGWGDGFCYEQVELANESIEEDNSGICTIHYYSFKSGKTEKLTNFPYKLTYLRGDNECFVTSDYLLYSHENSGRITLKENGTYNRYDIPGVVAGDDIKDSYKLTDKDILVFNLENFWIYNIKNKTYYKEKYKYLNDDPEHLEYLDIEAYDNQFAYIEPSKNKLIVHTITLNNGSN